MPFKRHLIAVACVVNLVFMSCVPSDSLGSDTLQSIREEVRQPREEVRSPKSKRRGGHDPFDDDDGFGNIIGNIIGGIIGGIIGCVARGLWRGVEGDAYSVDGIDPGSGHQELVVGEDLRPYLKHKQAGLQNAPPDLIPGLHGAARPCWSPVVGFVGQRHEVYGAPPYQQTIFGEAVYGEPVFGKSVYHEGYEPLPSVGSSNSFVPDAPLSPAMLLFSEPYNCRVGLEYGSDTDNLSQFGLKVLANKTRGWGVDSSVQMHRERYDDFRDQLWIGDFNVVREFGSKEYMRPRVGFGVNWLMDDDGVEGGLNLTLGADFKFWERMKVTCELDLGGLGDASLKHFRTTAGYALSRHVEWFVGYDGLSLGGRKINGALTGIRYRF